MSNLEMFGNNFVERVNTACKALSLGKGIILVDDEDRENEGDLIFSAEKISIENVNILIQDCSGIICLCLTPEKVEKLSLKPMVTNNTSSYQTAFTASIEAKTGVTTGVSASDRWTTIKTAIQEDCTPAELNQPGHVFPLVACKQGVLERRGHTEGSVDLMMIAGLQPSAVLCELMNKDGTMKKLPQLIHYAQTKGLPLLSVEDIYQYRLSFDDRRKQA
ncbi:3,4-dihydroxy-2-butanone-4-phosphate synthase [Legionella maioricensis]|uniref:3,4-dihydroxy-2-butanone 4-phosphate synthase n=1 Tax=Legionella maioricensis TaxID=2896528 RepID=A0A9X2I8J0_9GAMM|nr:3,4-dihydroxy-2-butanone-4-phosphate synthase [Legionella maioricensis]MCL9682475.1 3,4-dihydroxy-2-butanone-4-phosphate synthase [Legionella maioricensis]MCL9686278.1 3,4-dihydroxy-2-butanone-4-phosphate synthase [Legionella maioricensis]